GVSKKFFAHDEWCKDAAPSPDLRTRFHSGDLDFDEFSGHYRAELSRGDAAEAVEHLASLADDGPLVLAYAAKDTEHNHALVLADVVRGASWPAPGRRRAPHTPVGMTNPGGPCSVLVSS